MGKPRSKSRRSSAGKKSKRGLLTGMRSGFQNVAGSVTGLSPAQKKSPLGTIVTVILLIAALVLVLRRYT